MNPVVLNLEICVSTLVVLGLAHAYFPKRFRWAEETRDLSPLTRQVFSVHNAFIGLTVIMMGLISSLCAQELVRPSRLAAVLLAGLTAFWGARLYAQFKIYDEQLWLGKKFETRIHIALSLFWVYVTGTFGYSAWLQLTS